MKPDETVFVEGPIASQKEKDRILLQCEKPTRRRKTRESANEEWYYIQPLATGPFPFQEKAESGRISSNVQNKWKGRGLSDGKSKIIIDLCCLADKDNGAAMGRSSQKGWRKGFDSCWDCKNIFLS
jgi:hypothetical protein